MRESVRKNKIKIRDFKRYKETCQNTEEALKYLSIHKNCPYGKLEYGMALIHENREDEAKAVFEKLINTKNYKHALTNLIFIELVQKEYARCLADLIILEKEDKDYFDKGNMRYVKYLCMNMLDIKPDIPFGEMDYIESLIFNYNRDVVLNHISYHNKDIYAKKFHIEDFDEKKCDQRFFASNFDIEDTYDKVIDILRYTEVGDIYEYSVSTKLFFRYDNVGSNTNGKQNYLVVMFLTGTDRIITMCPVEGPERDYLVDKKPVYDFNEILEKARKQKAL